MNTTILVTMAIAVIAAFGAGAGFTWLFTRKIEKTGYDRGAADAGRALVVAQEKINSRDNEIVVLNDRSQKAEQTLEESRKTITSISGENSGVRATLLEMEKSARDLSARLSDCERKNETLNSLAMELKGQLSTKDETLVQERKNSEEKLKLLMDAKDQLKAEFQNLASAILEEKSERFTAQNKENIGKVLEPLREQLGDFRKRVDDVYSAEAKERHALAEHIKILAQLNQQVKDEAGNLTRALKTNHKTQGTWGEMVLERTLELSGLREGIEFHTQQSERSEDGALQRPDVVVHMPEDRDVIIDSKVSLVAFERAVNAESDGTRGNELLAHAAAVRDHVKRLSDKSYEKLPGVKSLDFVLLFMPIEAAFVAAIQKDPELFEFAYTRCVILVSPTTLLVTLRTIQNMWRSEYQNRNAQDIAAKAGAMYDKFVTFVETLEEVGKCIDRASVSYDKAHKLLSTGSGNLVRRAETLKELKAKTTKNLSRELLNAVQRDDEAAQIEDNSADEPVSL